jgi:hypothetical protein
MSANCNGGILDIPQALYGQNGISAYVYIAFADTVTPGTPDVVTGFSYEFPTPTSEWMAIFTTTTPINTPVAADFDNYWVEIKGASGVGAAGLDVQVNNTLVTGGPFTVLNFLAAGLTGITGADAGGGQVDVTIVTAAFNLRSRAQMLNLISLKQLIPGVSYWIYDQGDGADCSVTGDAGIIVRAISTDKLSLDAIYVARVVNRSAITGLFYSHTSYTTGDYVENFNEVYELVGATGTYTIPPAGDNVNWTFIDKSDTTYYLTEIHTCTYDIYVGGITGIITSRSDFRGNTVKNVAPLNVAGNEVIQQCFRWGIDNYYNNNIQVYQNVAGWGGGRLPAFALFDVSYFTVEFSNNTIEPYSAILNTLYEEAFSFRNNILKSKDGIAFTALDISTGTAGVSAPTDYYNNILINTLIVVYNIGGTISNCTINNSTINNNTDITIGYTRIESSTITGNTTSSIDNSDILNSEYSNNVNTSLFTSTINSSDVNANTDTSIGYLSSLFATITNNERVTITYIDTNNGIINDNRNLTGGVNPKDAILQELTLNHEGRIEGCRWNTPGSILRGTLKGNNGSIYNILFDNSVTRNLGTVAGTANFTVRQDNVGSSYFTFDMFTLDNAGIDGTNLSNAFHTPASAYGALITQPTEFSYVTITPNSSSAYAFLDMATAFAAGTLTIPAWAAHAGTIYLYGAAAQNVTLITRTSGTGGVTTFNGPIRFVKISDASTITFTPTAIAGAVQGNLVNSALAGIVLTRAQDFVEVRVMNHPTVLNQFVYLVENSKVVV